MATAREPDPRRAILVQIGASLVIGVIAVVVLLQARSDRGALFWVALVVAVVNAVEVAWFLAKYLRLSRERERLN